MAEQIKADELVAFRENPFPHTDTQELNSKALGILHNVQFVTIPPAGIIHRLQFAPHEQVLGIVSFVNEPEHKVLAELYRHFRLKFPVPLVNVPAGQTAEHVPLNR